MSCKFCIIVVFSVFPWIPVSFPPSVSNCSPGISAFCPFLRNKPHKYSNRASDADEDKESSKLSFGFWSNLSYIRIYGPALFNIHGSILKQSKFERKGDKEKKVWILKAGTLSIAQRSRVRVRTRTSSSPLPCFSAHCIGGSTSGRRHCWFNVAAPQVPQCYLSVSEG